jgi:DeoR/GlpR family transcriptional regulator of sugar metabolism
LAFVDGADIDATRQVSHEPEGGALRFDGDLVVVTGGSRGIGAAISGLFVQYRALGGCFVGPLAVSPLETFMLNIAFAGVTGLTDLGLTVADLSEAQVKLAAMNQARRVIVPMDHTKLGASGFARVCGLDRVDCS